MKSKRGFTLVEIIAVVAILVIVAGIFSINMIRSLNKNKEENQKSVVTQVKSAADAYVSANPEQVKKLYNGFGYIDIKVGELRDAGLLSEELKDAESGEKISDDEIVRVSLQLGDYVGFTYPVSPEDAETQAWSLIAEDLSIDYDPNGSRDAWCANRNNIYSGLYDSSISNIGNYAAVQSKLYLVDNSSTESKKGEMFKGNYFDDAGLKMTECNVNPKVSGTYNISYEYIDPSLKTVKKTNRTVYVKTSGNDVISFTAEINNRKKIVLNATNVPVKIVETYKDGSTATYNSNSGAMSSINYTIENFKTDTTGTRTATVKTTKTNSDGSSPTPAQPEYTVTDSMTSIITDSGNCTNSSTSGSTCYFRCAQSGNYVRYNGYLYRIYSMTGNSIKMIYDGTEIKAPYGQVGQCTSTSCCNGGRYLYNQLGQTNSGISNTMDDTLNSFYYSKGVNSSSKIQSQYTMYGSKKISLLERREYQEIAKSCSSNYLTGTAFWLADSAGTSPGAGTYNRGQNAAHAYDYAVNAYGGIYQDGAYKNVTEQYDFYTANVRTSRLAVRPTIQFNNPTIASGDGTRSNPYVIR